MGNWFDGDAKTKLAGKVAVVVGGGSGIGEGGARALAAAGATVVISGVPQQACDTVAQDLNDNGYKAWSRPCDATNPDDCDALFQETKEKFGRVDIFVSSCGMALPRQDVLTLEREKWDKIILINLTANFFLCQAAGRAMKDNGDEGGRIVLVSSARGFLPMVNAGPYAVTKAAVMGMIRSMCIDLAPYHITVNGIAPGYVMTAMVEKVFAELPAQKDFVMSRTPLKNIGSIDDMAAAILYFCLPTGEYTSGQTLIIDGGWIVNS